MRFAKASRPPYLSGTLEEHGEPENLCLSTFMTYMQACSELYPMPYVSTYLSVRVTSIKHSYMQSDSVRNQSYNM